jgi:hypothetical protein
MDRLSETPLREKTDEIHAESSRLLFFKAFNENFYKLLAGFVL